MFSITVLISGRGSNLLNLIKQRQNYEITHVISDNPQAPGLEYAREYKIPFSVIERKIYPQKSEFNQALTALLQECNPDLIALAGFMRLVPESAVNLFPWKIINIHPSLLPKHKGLYSHEQAIVAKDKYHGCTVHYVDAGIDTGPIIAQMRIPVLEEDSAESLAQRVLEKEHVLYPWVIKMIASNNITFDETTGKVAYTDYSIEYTKNLQVLIPGNPAA